MHLCFHQCNRLKIDTYMLRGVLRALNPLYIHVTFTVLSQGRNQGRPKYAKKI